MIEDKEDMKEVMKEMKETFSFGHKEGL